MEDKKNEVKKIFDSIAPKYDFLNHFLSFGVDVYWRKKALRLSNLNQDSILLDIACGTGDFANEARKLNVRKIFAADFSFNMLKLFKEKYNWINGKYFQTTAENLPLKNNSVTNITVAFGVRNFYDIPKSFHSFYSSLKDNGEVTILEFSLPKNKFIRNLYNFYFKNILPKIGGIISKNFDAYSYLPSSVEQFEDKIDLVKIFKEANFKSVKKYILTFGLVQVVIARK